MNNKRRKIIYMDDVKFSLMSVKEKLKGHYDVFTVDCEEALFELLGKITPQVILLDINMPEIDGFEVIEKLKADAMHANIPVIFLTGKSKDDKNAIIRGISLGAVDFIYKPVTTESLVKSIETLFDPELQKANRPIILSIDDTPSVLTSIHHILNDKYSVRTLTNPEKMQNLLKVLTPDLFLLDCNMPVLSGFDLVNIIRKMPQHSDTPIVFLTSEGTIDNISVAVHLGACDFLVKPIDENILREKMEFHLKDYFIRRLMRTD